MFQCLPLLCLGCCCSWWWYGCCWWCWCWWRCWRWCCWLYEVLRLFCWVLMAAEVFVLLLASSTSLCLSLLLGGPGTRRHLLFSPAMADSKNDVCPPPCPPPWLPTPDGSQSTSSSNTVRRTDRKTHNICIPSAGLTDYVFCKKFIIEWDFATFPGISCRYKIIYLIYFETLKIKSKISSDLKCKALKAS